MSGSEIFHRLKRYVHVALHCERTGQPAREALEELDHLQNKARERRRLLAAIGAGSALGAVPAAMRTALAAPRVSGSVAVVGAGLAGLSCAYALAGKGVRAELFEASQRSGGRCFSLYGFFPGQVAERGGEFIDTGHVTLRGFANGFGLSLEAVSKLPGEVFYFVNGQHHSEAEVVDEFRAFVPRLREDLQTLTPPTADDFTEADRVLDLTNLKDYLATRGPGPLIGKVLDVAYTIEYGRAIEEQSSLNLLLFIHADRRSKFRPFGVFSDERFHVVEGNQGITTGLEQALPRAVAPSRPRTTRWCWRYRSRSCARSSSMRAWICPTGSASPSAISSTAPTRR
jgi:monoamine oxidase